MEGLSCCFIGHRKIQDKEGVYLRVKKVVEELIVERGVKVFHFGSHSEFNDICHRTVTELQSSYPDIVRVNYHRKSEYVVMKEEKAVIEEWYKRVHKREATFNEFDIAKTSARVQSAGRASYVERNREMIDDSDFCIFFYLEAYKPVTSHNAIRRSGTKLAYDYAGRKGKNILNMDIQYHTLN